MDRIRVLLYDTDTAARDRVAEALEGESDGFDVTSVAEVESARTILDTGIDCVVLGDVTTEGDWVELVRSIRRDHRHLPIVLFTDADNQEIPNAAISAGVSEYVRKGAYPNPHTVLRERIRTLVARFRKQTRQRRPERRAGQYFELAGAIMVALDREGRIERINERGAEILGYDLGELLGRDWFEVAVPEEGVETARAAFEGLHSGEVDEYEVVRNEVLTKDGDRRIIEWRNNVLRDDTGTITGTLSAGRDVTEQRAQAEALEAERDRFVALFENIPEPAIVASFEDGKPIANRVNRAFVDVFGYEVEEVIGEDIDAYIVPPGASDDAQDFNEELVEGNSVQAEVTRLTASGPRDFRLHVVPLQPGTENLEGYAIYEDITELKNRQRVLEGLHAAATEIVGAESATEACERTVAAAEDILQFDLCEISLESDGELVPVASSEGIEEGVPAAASVEEGIAGKSYQTGESFVIDDLSREAEAKPQGPWSSALSVPIGTHGIFQAAAVEPGAFDEIDLELAELLLSHTEETLTRIETESALREREEALRTQNDRLERFTNVLSHDLRNPLNVAGGELDLARAEYDDPHLETVAQAHERMRELVDDVLTLARTDQTVTDPSVVDLRQTIEDCFGNVDTGDATLHVETEQVIEGDPSRLSSLFENLFRNAVEHGPPDVEIVVGALPDGFYVADTGPGIPESEREAVLEAGYSTGETGTGLGLNIVAQAVQAHGWEMTITEAEYGGARFEFTGIEVLDRPQTQAED